MAKPIDVSFHHIVRLEISRGPSLHAIQHVICSPNEDWCLHGVDFNLIVPYNPKNTGSLETSFSVLLTPVVFRRFYTNQFTLGCYLTDDLRNGEIVQYKNPPLQITNYSTKTREGSMEISQKTYLRFVQMLTELGL